MTEPRRGHTPDQVRHAIATMLDGTALHIEERDHELAITNPRDPERGHVYVAYDDAYVTWEHVSCEYWGELETLSTGQDRTVAADKIINTLTNRM